MQHRIHTIDTHTGGEPTRVVVESDIRLNGRTLFEKREQFRQKYDDYRRAIVCEPRGSDVVVGALITEPENQRSAAGVLFFNNVGTLGMCGHGSMGVAIALKFLGKLSGGAHCLDTPVGSVSLELGAGNEVAIRNVPSYRFRKRVPLKLASSQLIHGDIAWGGNWFFICEDHQIDLQTTSIDELSSFANRIRQAIRAQPLMAADDAEIDHVELVGPPSNRHVADARSFVLCPGGAYDRSPCGTGTSAKLACMAADGKLLPGQIYRQESIIGSVFSASFERDASGRVLPTLTGSAYVTGENTLLMEPDDPFRWGIVSP